VTNATASGALQRGTGVFLQTVQVQVDDVPQSEHVAFGHRTRADESPPPQDTAHRFGKRPITVSGALRHLRDRWLGPVTTTTQNWPSWDAERGFQ
jgi:hypothetical protein